MPCLVSSIRSLWLAGTNSITTGSPFTPAAVSLPLMRTVFKDRYLPPPDACTCLASSSPVVCPDAAAASEPPSSRPMQHSRIMVILLSRARFAPRPLVRVAETRRRGGHAIPVDDRPSRAAGLRLRPRQLEGSRALVPQGHAAVALVERDGEILEHPAAHRPKVGPFRWQRAHGYPRMRELVAPDSQRRRELAALDLGLAKGPAGLPAHDRVAHEGKLRRDRRRQAQSAVGLGVEHDRELPISDRDRDPPEFLHPRERQDLAPVGLGQRAALQADFAMRIVESQEHVAVESQAEDPIDARHPELELIDGELAEDCATHGELVEPIAGVLVRSAHPLQL